MKHDYVQAQNPVTKRFVKIDRSTGSVVAHKRTKGAYKNIPMAVRKEDAKMNVLITGSAGFIGRYLSRYLLYAGYQVTGIDRRIDFDAVVETEILDITKPIEPKMPDNIPDVIVHLAGFTSVQESFKQSSECWMNNGKGTWNIRKAFPDAFIIMASSIAAKVPVSPYGHSKIFAEEIIADKGISLRFSNVYGPGMEDKQSLIPKLMRAARDNTIMPVYGTGEHSRDFIHVYDVCCAIEHAIKLNTNGLEQSVPVEIGTGNSISVLDAIIAVSSASGSNISIEYCPEVNENDHVTADISKAQHILKWHPIVTFKEGIAKMWDGGEW